VAILSKSVDSSICRGYIEGMEQTTYED
jgi:hypothetical protein